MPYNYDLTFQEHILACIITDLEFVKLNRSVIKPEFFDDEILQAICNTALLHYEKRGTLPDKALLFEEIKEVVAPGRKYGEYKEKITEVISKSGTNCSYYKEKAIEFARHQALLDAVRTAQGHIEAKEYDKVEPTIRRALDVGRRTADIIYDYFKETRKRAISYQTKRQGSNTRTPTGIEGLDSITQGGLDKGELGMIVAPPKHGKSTALFNLGAHAIMKGKVVLHITLEMRKMMVAARYDSRFFGSNFREIQKKPRTFLDAMNKLKESLTGRLHVVEYPTKSVNTRELKSVAEDIPNLGMMIVDYADLLKPPRKRDENWIELADTYEELRGLAGELDIPIWTASQSKASSVGTKIIDIHQIAKAFDKAAIVDLAVSLCQTELEAHNGKMRLFVMANRVGPSKDQIECRVDWDTASIRSVTNDDDLE